MLVRVSETTLRKQAIKVAMPQYPQESKRKSTGVVVAEVHIDERGDVTDVDVQETPDAFIKEAVITAIKQWKFKPATTKGHPVCLVGKLTFYCVIDGQGARIEDPKTN
jgi:TonB family protein